MSWFRRVCPAAVGEEGVWRRSALVAGRFGDRCSGSSLSFPRRSGSSPPRPPVRPGSVQRPVTMAPAASLSGVVNTYYPGVGTAAAGATSIDVGAPSGAATPIAAGDLLLVIQMQAADFDTYQHQLLRPRRRPVRPRVGLHGAQRDGLVRVRAGDLGRGGRAAVSIAGLGAGAGLLNSYRTAAATATAGQRTFQVVRVPQYTTATTSSGADGARAGTDRSAACSRSTPPARSPSTGP